MLGVELEGRPAGTKEEALREEEGCVAVAVGLLGEILGSDRRRSSSDLLAEGTMRALRFLRTVAD